MRFIKYYILYFILLILKPITKASLKEIEDGAQALSLMTIKQIKKMWEELT